MHIALIGRSPEPVLNGFYHYGAVDKLFLLHSPNNSEDKFADKAREVRNRLAEAGFQGVYLKEIDAFDMNSIINAIITIVESEKPPFFINITGGTNMMAGAACAASFFVGAKAYYVMGKRGGDVSQYRVIELPVPNIPYYRDLSESQMSVLRALEKKGRATTTPELRFDLGISPQSLSYHVKQLQDKALIEVSQMDADSRLTNPNRSVLDRRVKVLTMTNAGKLVLRWTRSQEASPRRSL